MIFYSGGGTRGDFLPNLASTMCINRKFEEDSEQELALEHALFQVQLTNALWHRTCPPSSVVYNPT